MKITKSLQDWEKIHLSSENSQIIPPLNSKLVLDSTHRHAKKETYTTANFKLNQGIPICTYERTFTIHSRKAHSQLQLKTIIYFLDTNHPDGIQSTEVT